MYLLCMHVQLHSTELETADILFILFVEDKMASSVSVLCYVCVCLVIQGISVCADRKYYGVVVDHDGLRHVVELDGATKGPILQKGYFSQVQGWFDPSLYASTG